MSNDILAIIVVTFIVAVGMISNYVQINLLAKEIEEPMQVHDDYKTLNATGVYIPNCGFFVDTRGRRIENINKTIYHEACHALIQQDSWEHFCG